MAENERPHRSCTKNVNYNDIANPHYDDFDAPPKRKRRKKNDSPSFLKGIKEWAWVVEDNIEVKDERVDGDKTQEEGDMSIAKGRLPSSIVNPLFEPHSEEIRTKAQEMFYDPLINDALLKSVESGVPVHWIDKIKGKGVAENLGAFFIFCATRQEMYWQKQGDPHASVMDDFMLTDYRWCNLYRELDRGTRYFHAEVQRKYDKRTVAEVLWMAYTYRCANRVRTWVELGGIPGLPKTEPELNAFNKLVGEFAGVKERTYGFFASCHIQSGGFPNYVTALKGLLKPVNGDSGLIAIEAEAQKIEDILKDVEGNKLQRICLNVLKRLKGCGDFTSWQITCDLLESGVLGSCTEEDWMYNGPGALSGLERIFIGKVSSNSARGSLLKGFRKGKKKKADKEELVNLARVLRDIGRVVYSVIGVQFRAFRGRPITLKNIEHSLCEFSKYCNMKEVRCSESRSDELRRELRRCI